jgi:hypothetical protein
MPALALLVFSFASVVAPRERFVHAIDALRAKPPCCGALIEGARLVIGREESQWFQGLAAPSISHTVYQLEWWLNGY